MTKPCSYVASVVVVLILHSSASAQIERVWLSHRTNDTSKLVVSWTTKTPGDSTVRFGPTKEYGRKEHVPGSTTLHHVEIPLTNNGAKIHYSVSTGNQASEDYVFNGYPTKELRVAVVADWHRKPKLQAIEKDKIHLLLTAGDNISNLYRLCGDGTKDCTKPYEKLIDTYPEMFRSTPFMPVLGNHDRQIREYNKAGKPPPLAVFDPDATAFCKFFHLPDRKWIWHFDVPAFQVRFIALDLSHIEGRGTTLQACHDFKKGSEQFKWYDKLMANRPPGFVITIHNELNSRMREQEGGAWGKMFHKGNLVISGCGQYAERAEVSGMTYLNTSLMPSEAKTAKPKVKFHESGANYVLMRFHEKSATMTVELKGLDGKVLDHTKISMHKTQK